MLRHSKKTKEKELWITNVSKMNVSLADLSFTVRARTSVNLLSKNCRFTLAQIEKSIQEGSIFSKRDKIKVRKVAPPEPIKPGIYVRNDSRMTKPRSLVQVAEQRYDELNVSEEDLKTSDEKFAEEFATNQDEEEFDVTEL